jgi:hypothetical protein
MYGMDVPTQRLVFQGAKLGALSFGFVSFCTGIAVCVAYRLPVPPIAVTEIGVLLGGGLGAVAGYCWRFPAGRTAVIGILIGAVLGLPVAGLMHGAVRVLGWLGTVVMAGLVGYQAGMTGDAAQTSPWRLHKGP